MKKEISLIDLAKLVGMHKAKIREHIFKIHADGETVMPKPIRIIKGGGKLKQGTFFEYSAAIRGVERIEEHKLGETKRRANAQLSKVTSKRACAINVSSYDSVMRLFCER